LVEKHSQWMCFVWSNDLLDEKIFAFYVLNVFFSILRFSYSEA